MDIATLDRPGVYIAYPMSPLLKSISHTGDYKAKVNDQHTKVGKTEDSFISREKAYMKDFDNEVEFVPVALSDRVLLKCAEKLILDAVGTDFSKVKGTSEWFLTSNRRKIAKIIARTLIESGIEHELVGQQGA